VTEAVSADDLKRLDAASSHLEPPFAVVDLAALRSNAADMTRRAAGTPIRLASKSVRCRALIADVLAMEGFRGILAFTLPEALWLAECQASDDIVVAYPSTDRTALARLASSATAAMAITVMVDCTDHIDLIARAAATVPDPHQVKVAIDIDAGYLAFGGRLRAGARRSPIRTPAQAAELAGIIAGRPGRRQAGIVAAIRDVGALDFVNGGGTGSIERTAAEPAITEVGAGSGLYHPGLFDAYRAFRGKPAALFALPVVRRPGPGVVTVLGGGYLASGPAQASRLPVPYRPAGLKLDRDEGAGEVQTPLLGPAADGLRIGDRVWFRHAKAGELCERFNELHLIDGDLLTGSAPTYRGEGKAFL
jgi:D-serine deaminase-like pyridoxal phosphate-dependent protein